MDDGVKPTKPVEPLPMASDAEKHQYAQDMARWSEWIKEHPEDDVEEVEQSHAEPAHFEDEEE